MINKLNVIILKIISQKKFEEKIKLNVIKNNKLQVKKFKQNFLNKIIKYYILFFFERDYKNFFKNKCLNFDSKNFFFISYYLLCNITIKYNKKKNIKYSLFYTNNLNKQTKILNSSLYNFYYENKLNFYKKFNKIYLNNYSENYNFRNHLIPLYKLKKKEEIINPKNYLILQNKTKSFRFKIIKKVINKINYFHIFENLFFNKNQNNRKIISNNFNFKSFTKKKIFNLNSDVTNLMFIKALKTNIRIVGYFNYNNGIEELFFFTKKIFLKKKFKFNRYKFLNSIDKKFLNYKLKNFFIYNIKNVYIIFEKIFSFYTIKTIKRKPLKKKHLNSKLNNFSKFFENAYKNIIFLNDFYGEISHYNITPSSFLSNNFFLKNLTVLNKYKIYIKNKNPYNTNNELFYNNYYPIFYTHKKTTEKFFSKFRINLNINYLVYMQYYILGFLENFFKKKFFIKTTNNFFQKYENFEYLSAIFNDYKNFQPKYMKSFLIKDFLEIIWYSFYLRDLTLLSDWITKFLEATNFRVHKKFLLFFNNFINKYSNIFIDILRIKGFFFDIRGKVGVTGNSKKRHHFFKIGKLNKSTKVNKINFNQSVARTPSGALGLTFIVNY